MQTRTKPSLGPEPAGDSLAHHVPVVVDPFLRRRVLVLVGGARERAHLLERQAAVVHDGLAARRGGLEVDRHAYTSASASNEAKPAALRSSSSGRYSRV